MNGFLFALLQSALVLTVMIVFYALIPASLLDRFFGSHRKLQKTITQYLFVALFFALCAININAYGPRHSLPRASMPAAPERLEIKARDGFIEEVDRRGAFDQPEPD